MNEFLNALYERVITMSGWEAVAVFLSIAYILLAIKESLWCWPAAFFSTLIYAILFFDASLLMDSVLNTYYLLMAIYGWYMWRYGSKQKDELLVTSWKKSLHVKIIIMLAIISLIFGYIMANYTSADFAYTDSFTTVFAIYSTYMLAQKVLENWLYWIVIDAISIYIYIHKGFYLTAVLFMIYTVMALIAYFEWKKEYAN